MDIYGPCLCGSGKKFKFCCCSAYKEGKIPLESDFCSNLPIYDCKILPNQEDVGISPIHIVRQLTDTTYVLISYLIDFWCLGLKDAFINYGLSSSELQSIFQKGPPLISLPYEEARSFILGSIDFARKIDIEPHSNWQGIVTSFIEAKKPYKKQFVFGKDGHPFYVAGPYDVQRYDLTKLIKKIKDAGGDYIINISDQNG
ncbi:MAG: hypothetical protein V4489_05905 [Chlamydiota bacterium]